MSEAILSEHFTQPGRVDYRSPIKFSAALVETLVMRNRWRFYFGDEEVIPSQMGDPACCLPLVIWQANRLHRAAFGKEMGFGFKADEKAFLGLRPVAESRYAEVSLASLFCRESLQQLYRAGAPGVNLSAGDRPQAASLDQSVQQFLQDIIRNKHYGVILPERVISMATGHSKGLSTWPTKTQ